MPIIALLLPLVISVRGEGCCIGTTGNVDNSPDVTVDIADLVYLADYMFNSGPEPPCPEEADMNGDQSLDIADLVYLADYMFSGGPAPVDCPPDVISPQILPLAIGNSWTSDVIEYNEYGQQTNHYVSTGTVVADTVINNRAWYFLTADTTGADSSLWTNKIDGAWAWTDSVGQPEALMMKYPSTAGESYPVYDITLTVESISTSITVPAGTFECYYYRAHIPIYGTVGKIWACPDIGVVRAEEYGLTLFGTYLAKEVELLEYNLVAP